MLKLQLKAEMLVSAVFIVKELSSFVYCILLGIKHLGNYTAIIDFSEGLTDHKHNIPINVKKLN